MKTVTIELRDIDYDYTKEDADKKGITIAEYIMNRYSLNINDKEKMTTIEILTEDLLNGSSSMEEMEERAEVISCYADEMRENAYMLFEDAS